MDAIRVEYLSSLKLATSGHDISDVLASAMDASTYGISIGDATQAGIPLIYVNRGFERITGFTRTEALGKPCSFLQGSDRDQKGIDEIRVAIRNGTGCKTLLRNYRPTGECFLNEISISPLLGADGKPRFFIGTQNDVTSHYSNLELAHDVLGSIDEAFFSLNFDWKITFVNRVAEQVFGKKSNQLVGQYFWDEFPKSVDSEFHKNYRKVMADRTPLHFEEYSRSLSKWIGANVLPVANGIAIYFRDVTDQRDKDARLEFQANNDSLTGLANRRTFMTDLELRMLDSDATGVLVADLDGFQQLNETRGHKVGDELLRQAAVRLRRLSSSTMKVYRASGDEFVFLISDPKPNTHQLLASSINKAFSLPFQHLGSEYHLGMAMGCATYPNDVDSTLDLIGAAEAALLFAKEQPKGSLVAFTPKMREAELRRIELVQAIEASTFEEGLSLYLQPQIDLATNELRSFEALVRWTDKKLGFVSPAEFIPLAEAAGLIPKIDNFIIETVCAQQRRWLDEGTKVVPIAVNAAPSSVLDKTFLAKMEEVTTKYGISKDLLAIEMTESAAMLNSESAMDALAEIADAGVEVHLDDFGSGYSNLSRLRHLSVSVIKLDKSLVQDIETDVVGQSIILAITQIAARLDRLVLAEGIEDVDHLTTLQSLGVHLGQGYLLGRPAPAVSFTELLKQPTSRSRE